MARTGRLQSASRKNLPKYVAAFPQNVPGVDFALAAKTGNAPPDKNIATRQYMIAAAMINAISPEMRLLFFKRNSKRESMSNGAASVDILRVLPAKSLTADRIST